ncbi:NAD dependent epimerase/dehydratase [Mycena filopes]|nr:NAD dependent epimerase/dehydratase [Mycena filopes]
MSLPDHNSSRIVPLQVLCLGVSRTGTSSMKHALEMLGYVKTNHGMDAFRNPYEAEMWTEAINAKFFAKGRPYGQADWDRLLGHCQAVTDVPHYLFAKELIEAYPDAKVVLTIRDQDSWWASTNATIGKPIPLLWRLQAWVDANAARRLELFRLTWRVFYGTEDWRGEERLCKARFAAHNEHVRGLVARERLLEFDVKEGWGPLCAFLAKEVPGGPFPRLLDTIAFQKLIKQSQFAGLKQILIKVAPLVAVLAFACFQFRCPII